MKELPWMHHLKTHLGLAEIPGKAHNPTLLQWLRDMGQYAKESKAWWTDDETPWCGLAVGHALGSSGRFVVPHWFRAKAWADSGAMTKLDKPAYGAIATKTRKGGGHVFFVVGRDKQGRLLGLGGNQGNRVSIIPFNESELDGFWWPSKWENGQCVKSAPAPERFRLPILPAHGLRASRRKHEPRTHPTLDCRMGNQTRCGARSERLRRLCRRRAGDCQLPADAGSA